VTKYQVRVQTRRNDRKFDILHPDGRIVRYGKLRKDGTRKVRTLVNA
jgi:hypothetical protein